MNDIIKIILTSILGIVSGVLGAAFGLGVTTLAVPGFLLLGLVPNTKTSIGTTLVASPSSWPAAYEYYKKGYSDVKLGITYFLFYLAFAYFGAKLNSKFSENVTNYLVSAIHFLIALYFLYQATKSSKPNRLSGLFHPLDF